jgi:hypothetical protein
LKLIPKSPLPPLIMDELKDELNKEYSFYEADRMPGSSIRSFNETCDDLTNPIALEIIKSKNMKTIKVKRDI